MDDAPLSLDLFAEDGRGDAPQETSAEPEVWTVSQVNRAVRSLLESEIPPLWVTGEVANWKRAQSGHCYFTLKDENAQLRCVMWRTEAARLPTDPDNGMELRSFGNLTLYEVRGEYQLVVRRIEAGGAEGLWRLAFDRLKAKLDAEGLTDPARRRPLPRFPTVIGVVTSTTGAALRDILSVLARRAPWTHVLVHGTRVQGEGAALEIAHALTTLATSGRVDVVIVGRGGGSIEDLWAFNEEPVARAIADSPVPVISAVGHEVDVTISDLVADLRAPTPSAAAEAAVQDRSALLEALGRVGPRLRRALRTAVGRRRSAIERGVPRLRRALAVRVEPRRLRAARGGGALRRAVLGVIGRHRRRAELGPRLARSVRVRMDTERARASALASRLEALSPLATLKRGYAVPLTREGRVLRRVGDFARGRRFVLRVVDGRVACEAESILEEQRREDGR